MNMPDTSDTYLAVPHMVSEPLSCSPGISDLRAGAALPARLHPDPPLAPRYPLRALRKARQAPRALALPARIAAHARPRTTPRRLLPLPEPDANIRRRRRATKRRARHRRRRRPGKYGQRYGHRRATQPPAELDTRARRTRAQGRRQVQGKKKSSPFTTFFSWLKNCVGLVILAENHFGALEGSGRVRAEQH
jgi:hypothetical protein